LVAAGKLKYNETVIEGIENAPSAFIGLLAGENLGKMLVKVGPDPSEAA
jgi:NADPH-dependent curcumin reductase CurA